MLPFGIATYYIHSIGIFLGRKMVAWNIKIDKNEE